MRFRFQWLLVLGLIHGSARPFVARGHGSLHEVIRRLDAWVEAHPGDSVALLNRADLHRLHGDFDKSLADLAAAEKISPKLEGAGWVRARVFADQGKPQEALLDLNSWLERHPRHADALALRGKVRELAGDLTGAVADFDLAIAVVPKPDPDLYLARAGALQRLGSAHLPLALQGLDESENKLGLVEVLQLRAAEIEESLGRSGAALARLDQMAAKASRKETWHVRRAELLDRAGRPEEAQAAWQAALFACQALPPHLRKVRAVQDLEQRSAARLPPERRAAARPLQPPVEASARNISAASTSVRTMPVYETTTR